MTERYQAIVIGGGHNGLVAATYLARAGRRVLLLERRPSLGGAAGTVPWTVGSGPSAARKEPDGTALVAEGGAERSPQALPLPVGAQDVSLFRPQILRDLDLDLPLLRPEVPLLALLPEGGALPLWRDPQRAADAIAAHSPDDARQYPRFAARVARQAAVLEQMLDRTPPNLPVSGLRASARAGLPWLGVALGLRRLGPRPMMEFIRTLPMDVAGLLEEWFETPVLQGALAAGGIVGAMQGPRSSGTALMMLYQSIGGFPRGASFVRGGVQVLIDRLQTAAERSGVEIRTSVAVERVLVNDYAAVGVRLEGGQEIGAEQVLSSADPRHTLLDLVGAPQLELRVVRRVGNIRFQGSTARVNLITQGLPDFAGVSDPAWLLGHIVVAPSLDYLERAHDDAKYRRISANPHLSFTIPTMHAEPFDGNGPQVIAIDVRYTPYELSDGGWSAHRDQLADRVIELLSDHAPDLPGRVVQRQVLTPADLESEFGLSEGSIHHGQMALDQLLFMRPIGGYAQYRSPVQGLYFCGAGAHPGGGLTGAPGRNAAARALRDLRSE